MGLWQWLFGTTETHEGETSARNYSVLSGADHLNFKNCKSNGNFVSVNLRGLPPSQQQIIATAMAARLQTEAQETLLAQQRCDALTTE